MSAVAVRVHILSEERDFPEPARGQTTDFFHDARQGPAPFPPPCERHHAKGAELVASAHHRNPGADALGPQRHNVLVGFHTGEADGNPLFPFEGAGSGAGKLPVFVRTDNDVHKTLFLDEPFPQPLRHAAENPDHQVGIPAFLGIEQSQPAVNTLLGIVPDGTGVHQNDIGIPQVTGEAIPLRRRIPPTSSQSARFIWQPYVSM